MGSAQREPENHQASAEAFPSGSGSGLSSGQGMARLGRLVRKELSEVLRDRRTIITLVFMPLLLYPLLAMAFPQFLLSLGGEPRSELRIGIPPPPESTPETEVWSTFKIIQLYLGWGIKGPAGRLAGSVAAPAGGGALASLPALLTWREAGLAALPLPPHFDPFQPGGRAPPQLLFFEENDLEKAVRSGVVHLGVRLRRPQPGLPWARQDWELIYRADSPHAADAIALFERLCLAANTDRLQPFLQFYRGPPQAPLVRVLRRPVHENTGGLRVSLTAVIPLILILMTITGAVYPAIDLTAGERERGTLEILVAAPVPRLALLFAKYVSVVTVAVLTATVNLVMMMLTLQFSGLAQALAGDQELSVSTVLLVFGLLLLFAAFFSAVLLALTSFARSFKEAQAYLIPLMLVSLAPGLVGMLPGLKLTGLYAVTPLLNIVLLGRDLFGGHASLSMAVVVVFSTLAYALAALAGAARIFGAESVLYSEQGSWSDLLRRPAEPREAALPAGALLCLAFLFPLNFVVNSMLGADALDANTRLLLQVLGTLLLFAVLPLLVAAWGRLRWSSAFNLRTASWLGLVGAVLLGIFLIPLVYELLAVLRDLGLTFLSPGAEQQLQALVKSWREQSPLAIGLAMAVIGAAEEVFFRGYLFSALRRVGGARAAIVGSAVLFGLFHGVSIFDRLLPSTLLGLILGWVCWRTGSIVPAMLLHASYDALWRLLAYYQKDLIELLGWETATHLPWSWVAAGLVGVALGVGLILCSKPSVQAASDVPA